MNSEMFDTIHCLYMHNNTFHLNNIDYTPPSIYVGNRTGGINAFIQKYQIYKVERAPVKNVGR